MPLSCVFFPLSCIGSRDTLLDLASDRRIVVAQYAVLVFGESASSFILAGNPLPVSALFFGIGLLVLYPVLMEFRRLLAAGLKAILEELLVDESLAESIVERAKGIAFVEPLAAKKLSGNSVLVLLFIGLVVGAVYAGIAPRCLGHKSLAEDMLCILYGPEHAADMRCVGPACIVAEAVWALSLLMYTYIYMYAVSAVPYVIALLSALDALKNQSLYDTRLGKFLQRVHSRPLDTDSYDLTPLLEFHERVALLSRPVVRLVVALMAVALLAAAWYKIIGGYGSLVIAMAVVAVSVAVLAYAVYTASSLLVDIKEKARKATKLIYVAAAREAQLRGLEDIPKPILRMIHVLEESADMLRTIPLSVHDMLQLIGVAATLIATLATLVVK